MATNFMKNEDNWIHLKTDITNRDGSTILWKWCQKRNHPKSDNTSVQNIQVSGEGAIWNHGDAINKIQWETVQDKWPSFFDEYNAMSTMQKILFIHF